ncbi:hypothetical protein [Luteolibacter sp. AS25]|uniref:hypothetical protein n=1 Tax=Luteolibacter sp. AS25 TaxID=3135776 RepID=UPI00398AFA94
MKPSLLFANVCLFLSPIISYAEAPRIVPAPRVASSPAVASEDNADVSGAYVYGWIDNSAEQFFTLDTKSDVFVIFNERSSLDEHTDTLSLPRLSMSDSYTYWDIRSGHKQWK